jgi:hypothetical protein
LARGYLKIKLAGKMRQAFQCYVAENPEVHISAGISTTKPSLPIGQLGGMAEKALDHAKSHNPPTPVGATPTSRLKTTNHRKNNMEIKLSKTGEKLDPELFNTVAQQAARRIAAMIPEKRITNRPS